MTIEEFYNIKINWLFLLYYLVQKMTHDHTVKYNAGYSIFYSKYLTVHIIIIYIILGLLKPIWYVRYIQ